jgi:dienelactone hydrolase
MRFTSQTTADGVLERFFTCSDIPGVLWSPADADGSRPLVLLVHGGGQHKTSPPQLARARRLVTDCGFAAAAIDAPGCGGRPKTAPDEQFAAEMAELRQRGMPPGESLGPRLARYNAAVAARAVPEWQAVLNALQEHGDVAADAPVGIWGLSMGAAIGIPLAAAEPRITAAVVGLAGHETLAAAAAQVTVPVRFLLQWDDEFVPRDSALALFGAFASPAKTLHANPGGHTAVPLIEHDDSVRFLARALTPAAAAVAG